MWPACACTCAHVCIHMMYGNNQSPKVYRPVNRTIASRRSLPPTMTRCLRAKRRGKDRSRWRRFGFFFFFSFVQLPTRGVHYTTLLSVLDDVHAYLYIFSNSFEISADSVCVCVVSFDIILKPLPHTRARKYHIYRENRACTRSRTHSVTPSASEWSLPQTKTRKFE